MSHARHIFLLRGNLARKAAAWFWNIKDICVLETKAEIPLSYECCLIFFWICRRIKWSNTKDYSTLPSPALYSRGPEPMTAWNYIHRIFFIDSRIFKKEAGESNKFTVLFWAFRFPLNKSTVPPSRRFLRDWSISSKPAAVMTLCNF